MEPITGGDKIELKDLRCVKMLVRKLGVDGEALTLGCSDMRTTHVSELKPKEAKAMIRELKKLDKDEASAELMRRKLIGLAYTRAGLPQTANKRQKQNCVDDLNDWCKHYGYLHKALNSYTKDELPKLVSQYESVVKSDIKRI